MAFKTHACTRKQMARLWHIRDFTASLEPFGVCRGRWHKNQFFGQSGMVFFLGSSYRLWETHIGLFEVLNTRNNLKIIEICITIRLMQLPIRSTNANYSFTFVPARIDLE